MASSIEQDSRDRAIAAFFVALTKLVTIVTPAVKKAVEEKAK